MCYRIEYKHIRCNNSGNVLCLSYRHINIRSNCTSSKVIDDKHARIYATRTIKVEFNKLSSLMQCFLGLTIE